MNQKIQKIVTEIEKVKSKIATQQARLRELEQQKTELENTEIVGMVRGLEVTPEELATIIQAIRSGNTGGLSVAAQNPEDRRKWMMKNKLRYFMVLTALAMCFGTFSVTAYAQSNEPQEETAPVEETTEPEETATPNPFTPNGTGNCSGQRHQ